jgi:hypothetical protein
MEVELDRDVIARCLQPVRAALADRVRGYRGLITPLVRLQPMDHRMRSVKVGAVTVAALGAVVCASTQVEAKGWAAFTHTGQPVITVADATGDAAQSCATGCAPAISTESAIMVPGVLQTKKLKVSYNGSGGRLAIRLGRYSAKAADSSPLCRAADPADKIDLRIEQDGRLVFDGTLSEFAGVAGAELSTSRDSVVTFTYGLDGSAGNAYMGCRSAADLVWEANG